MEDKINYEINFKYKIFDILEKNMVLNFFAYCIINVFQVAWAPGIGVKESEFKDRWDVEQGVTYVPWPQMPEDLTRLKDGGIIDEESLPENLKGDKCHNYTIVKIEKKLVNSSTTHKLGFSNNFIDL